MTLGARDELEASRDTMQHEPAPTLLQRLRVKRQKLSQALLVNLQDLLELHCRHWLAAHKKQRLQRRLHFFHKHQ